jgi:hypothetical protein
MMCHVLSPRNRLAAFFISAQAKSVPGTAPLRF